MKRFPQAGWSKSYQPPKDSLKFLDALFWVGVVAFCAQIGVLIFVVVRTLKGWPI